MAAITFDTMKYSKRLEAAGYTREQAEVQTAVQAEIVAVRANEGVATRGIRSV